MDIQFVDTFGGQDDVVIVPVFKNKELGANAENLDKLYAGFISATLRHEDKFNGEAGQSLTIRPVAGAKRIVLAGMGGDDEKITKDTAIKIASTIDKAVRASGYENATFLCEDFFDDDEMNADFTATLADVIRLKSYSFDKYKAKKADGFKRLSFAFNNVADVQKAYQPKHETTSGVFLARDMSNEPPNIMTPEKAAQTIQDELGSLPGVTIRVLDEKDMENEKMGAALAVGQGSINPPRMVIMEYDGTDGDDESWPLALVGKGITFDTGGYNLKPTSGMGEMKHDMGGAATVVGAMRSLAGRKAKTKAVAIVALAENMVSDRAILPSSIITAKNGKTIEIGNTDAEGRLVLADAMTYIQEQYNPDTMFDFATLTGAALVALGHDSAAVFTHDFDGDVLIENVRNAGKDVQERVWPLPLSNNFTEAMVGKDADLTNNGSFGGGGASTAAAFLENFVDEGRSWVHFDIAGMAMNVQKHPIHPAKGATGFGIRLIDRYVSEHLEPQSTGAAPAAKRGRQP